MTYDYDWLVIGSGIGGIGGSSRSRAFWRKLLVERLYRAAIGVELGSTE